MSMTSAYLNQVIKEFEERQLQTAGRRGQDQQPLMKNEQLH